MRKLAAPSGVAGVLVLVVGLGLGSRLFVEPSPRFQEVRMLSGGDIPAAVALGADDSVWFTIENGNALGVLREGKLHHVPKGGDNLEPLGLATVADGSVWFTDPIADAIGHVTSDGSLLESFPLPSQVTQFGRLTVAADGSVWVADSWSNSLVRFRDGQFTAYPASSGGAAPFGVTADAQGGVWATYQVANKLVHVDAVGQVTELEPPTRSSGPTDLAVDASGAVWFVELRAGKIARFDPAAGRFSEFALPQPQAGITDLAIGPDGSVWFPELRAKKLGRLRDGVVREIGLARSDARPFGVRVDRRGNVWYSDLSGWLGMLPAADTVDPPGLDLWRQFSWPHG